eukprot:GHVP01029269.1.p1 GENE.GHVP01029269.1~~GHVP01029269.1.p1  ORF type:complete len:227 (+),score=34.25 GHVP01029269.1:228-908(+)
MSEKRISDLAQKHFEDSNFFVNYRHLVNNDDNLMSIIKNSMKNFIDQKDIMEQIAGAEYQGFDPELIMKIFLSKLTIHKNKDDQQKYFRSFVLILAIGISRGTSRKAIQRSKNDQEAWAAIKSLGVDVPEQGHPFEIKRETLTIPRLMTIHPLLCFIIHNTIEPQPKFSSDQFFLPNFVASPALIFLASKLGYDTKFIKPTVPQISIPRNGLNLNKSPRGFETPIK